MKFPKEIYINSHAITVTIVDNLPDRIAEIDPAGLVIKIGITCGLDNVVVPESMQAEGFLHELIHFITISNGYGVQEKLVSCIAHNLLGIIRLNKLDFKDTR